MFLCPCNLPPSFPTEASEGSCHSPDCKGEVNMDEEPLQNDTNLFYLSIKMGDEQSFSNSVTEIILLSF